MQAPFTRLEPLVQTLAEGLAPLLDKPFAFFGHSLGALVAFELTRQLRRQSGVQPTHLFVSAGHAPQIAARDHPMHGLPEEELLDALRRLSGIPQAVLEDKDIMRIMLPVLRADLAIYETYVYLPERPLACPIWGFGGLSDQRVSRGDLEAWRSQTSASFSLRMLAGDHFFLNASQPLLLQALSLELSGGA
jgi:medium-chain acyl-[acyl-carrier-protein] hydrolase